MEDEEEVRLRRAISEAAVGNYGLLCLCQEANATAGTLSLAAQAVSSQLSESITKLQANSDGLAQAGMQWRREKQLLASAVSQHQKLLSFTESPALLEECIRSELYHEALLVLEHMTRFSQCAPHVHFFHRISEDMQRTLAKCLEETILPRLSGPLSVDTAFKLITFLRRLGVHADQLVALFLGRRSQYIDQLVAEANSSSLAYSRVLKYIRIYKVSTSEVVLQYSACFPSEADSSYQHWDDALRWWCYHQANRFVDSLNEALGQVTHSSELALIVEQCSSCSANASTLHCDVGPAINRIILNHLLRVFEQHMSYATKAYTTSMQTFSWRAAMYTPARELTVPGTAASSLPISLSQWLPLSYALNGMLTAFNSIRKCLIPGLEVPCVRLVATLVQLIASDLRRDGDLVSTMDTSEGSVYRQVVQAFTSTFYPYVLSCTGTLLGEEMRRWMDAALSSEVQMLVRRLPTSDDTAKSQPMVHSAQPLLQPPKPPVAPQADAGSGTTFDEGLAPQHRQPVTNPQSVPMPQHRQQPAELVNSVHHLPSSRESQPTVYSPAVAAHQPHPLSNPFAAQGPPTPQRTPPPGGAV